MFLSTSIKCRGDVKSDCTVGVDCGWIVGM